MYDIPDFKVPNESMRGTARVRSSPTNLATWVTDNLKSDSKSFSVLDFGAGHGFDAAYLNSKGFHCEGWDPVFSSTLAPRKEHYDLVLLAYVLNVIPSLNLRKKVLLQAWHYSLTHLLIAVRMNTVMRPTQKYQDGVITSIGAFQKVYTPIEIKEWCDQILDSKGTFVGKNTLIYRKNSC
ncbi:MAG: methyltransferase domain-containing protein [Oligoflexales bacterium]